MSSEDKRDIIAAVLFGLGLFMAIGTCGAVEFTMLPLENFLGQTVLALLLMAASMIVSCYGQHSDDNHDHK